MTKDESRFEDSHGFTNLLGSQAMDVLCGKQGKFCIKTNYSTAQKEKVFRPDLTVDGYMFRQKDLEHVCLYECWWNII